MWEILIYAFSMFMTGALLFLMVYSKMKYYNALWKFALNNPGYRLLINLSISLIKLSIITLSDLECDYLNAQECCNRLNFWVRPKIVAQTIIVVGFLTDGNLWMALVNIPAAAWVIYEFVTVPRGNTGLFDPTEIHHRGQLKKHMRNFVIFTGWYLITFFFYLYFMILAILKGNPLETDAPQHVNKF